MSTLIAPRSTYGQKSVAVLSMPSPSRYSSDDADSYSDDGSLGPQDHIKPTFVDVVKPKLATVEVAAPPVESKPARLSVDDKIMALTNAMTFLPLEDIEAARLAGPLFAIAANRVAPKPLGNDDVVFVRWQPQQQNASLHKPSPVRTSGRHAAAAQPAHLVFPWRCLSCGNISVGPRSCNHCHASLAVSACRVFLGQIRKDLSAEAAIAMVNSLAPEVTVLHMESHTNAVDGRGKGCAWAYVDSVEDAVKLTELHKRVFMDLDAEGGEGFWFVKDAKLVPQLIGMAEIIGEARVRPLWLPRQPLVAELPGKSMLADYVLGSRRY